MKYTFPLKKTVGWTALTSLEDCAAASRRWAMFYLSSTSGLSGVEKVSRVHSTGKSLDRLSTTIWAGVFRSIEPTISIGRWPAGKSSIRKVECRIRKLASTMPKVGCGKRKLKGQMLNVGCEKVNVHPTELEGRIRKLVCCLWKVECRKRKLECCINQSWIVNAKKLNRECKLKWQTQNVG